MRSPMRTGCTCIVPDCGCQRHRSSHSLNSSTLYYKCVGTSSSKQALRKFTERSPLFLGADTEQVGVFKQQFDTVMNRLVKSCSGVFQIS